MRGLWLCPGVLLLAAALSPAQVNDLAAQRRAFEELTEAYEAMRRMVERGYLGIQSKP